MSPKKVTVITIRTVTPVIAIASTQQVNSPAGVSSRYDEHVEDDGIEGGDDGGFGRGEGAGEDAADDEYRRQQRPKRLFERPSAFGGGRFRRLAVAAFFTNDGVHRHQQNGEQHTGDETGEEELGDGNIGNDTVNNHRDTRRHQRADDAGGCGNAAAEVVFITGVAHRLDFQLPQTARIGQCRAGHPGENQTGGDIHMPHAAGVMPQHGKGEIENAGGDTGAIHQNPGEDEKRHAQQTKTVDTIDQFGRGKITSTPAGHGKEQYCGDEKRPADRHSGKHNNQPKDQRDINGIFAKLDIFANAQRFEPGRLNESHQKHRHRQNKIHPNRNEAIAFAIILLLCLQKTEEHQDSTDGQRKIQPFIRDAERNELIGSLIENGDAIIKEQQNGAENNQLHQAKNPDPQLAG